MKFKRILKRKVYPTWVSTRRLKGCLAYVFEVPNTQPFYHFQIVCDTDITHASLAHGVKFNSFSEACLAAEQWIRNN